ncbi:glyoxalase [Achromobacter sp. DMS1]|uniref:VOC family protein n=1 Tax=Achromobacter sp. DMS1 TaxID=1688405 RepID=UPI00069CE2A5|nr:VOC family protein [Achromobacter sp. DMS1]KOF54487.1 glyoxalase [Achromobacter sp. DMS1]
MSRPATRPIPEGMHTLTPHLVCEGAAAAIDFYKTAFNAEQLSLLPGPDGKVMHAMLRIGDSALMLSDDFPSCGSLGPKALKGSPVTLHLYVENVDAAIKQAVDAGAQVTMPATDMFWGDRYGQVVDPCGHRWSLATHKQDLSPEEIREGMARMCAEMGNAKPAGATGDAR